MRLSRDCEGSETTYKIEYPLAPDVECAPALCFMSPNSRNLDFLRTVAVLCVFTTHLIYFLSGTGQSLVRGIPVYLLGQTGVLLFFVHTALVLMRSMERMRGRNLVVNFYVRRIFRIYPLSIVCIGAVLLFRIPVGNLVETFTKNEIISNLLLVQNLHPYKSVSAPLWSLPYEVQMYLMLPAIFFLLKRFPTKLSVLLLWVAICGAEPFAPVLLEYVPCFLGGVLAYQLSKERTFALPSWVLPISIVSFRLA
jgi:peptidoglycan/LPS O-acetylase OafA/YrhL